MSPIKRRGSYALGLGGFVATSDKHLTSALRVAASKRAKSEPLLNSKMELANHSSSDDDYEVVSSCPDIVVFPDGKLVMVDEPDAVQEDSEKREEAEQSTSDILAESLCGTDDNAPPSLCDDDTATKEEEPATDEPAVVLDCVQEPRSKKTSRRKKHKRVIVIRNIKGRYPEALPSSVVDKIAKLGISEDSFRDVLMGAHFILVNESRPNLQCFNHRSEEWGCTGAVLGGVGLGLAAIAAGPFAFLVGAAGALAGGSGAYFGSQMMDSKENTGHLGLYLVNVNRRFADKNLRWRVLPARSGDISVGIELGSLIQWA